MSLSARQPSVLLSARDSGSAPVGERVFVLLTLLAMLILPPILIEPFPLSLTPMFAYPMDRRHQYELRDASGHRLDADIYGLRTNPNFRLERFYGVRLPQSLVVPPDKTPDLHRLIPHIRSTAIEEGAQFPLALTWSRVALLNQQSIGVDKTRLIHVMRDFGSGEFGQN